MMKNNIFALGNFNSHITQININGSSKEEIEQLCLKLINDQMSILRDDAAEIFKSQVREYAELFYRQLLKMPEGVDVVNRLKTPAVQFALDESLMIYSKHPSVDEKELQVEILIDKIKHDDSSTKGVIIDAARLELCNITNAQISLLAFMIISSLKCESEDRDELTEFFRSFGPLLDDILPMKSVDYAYLQNTNCLHRISFVDKADFVEKELFKGYAEKTGHSSEEEFKRYLNTTYPLWSTILDNIKYNNMACYKPTAVGLYIGLKRINKVCGWDLEFDKFYDAR